MAIEKKNVKNIPLPTNFGKNLRFLRRVRGLSQTAIAKEVNLTRNNIASYESGVVEPNSTNFLMICNFFQVEPRKMLESIMAENPLEESFVPEQDSPEEEYIVSELDQFMVQTNEMTKVLEGYKLFFDMKKDEYMTSNPELFSTLQDLLSLLSSLVQSNWALIQHIVPTEEEE